MSSGNPAPRLLRRRTFLGATAGLTVARARADEPKRLTVAFANLTEDPAVRLEGTGFTGGQVRDSFSLAARRLPIDLVLYDNMLDTSRALANVEDAIRRRADVYIHYGWSSAVNADIGRRLAKAEIPVIAVSQPIPGAPLYSADNAAAGRIAGEALARHAAATWPERSVQLVIIGPPADRTNRLDERATGIAAALKPLSGTPVRLDTGGNPLKVDAVLRGFLSGHAGQRVLVGALDDATALAAKAAVESAGRNADVVIVSQGCDRSVHGNAAERKELDPANRGTILLGSVGFFLDRYGYDVLPLALDLVAHRPVAALTTTQHRLVTPANAFVLYPPSDMN